MKKVYVVMVAIVFLVACSNDSEAPKQVMQQGVERSQPEGTSEQAQGRVEDVVKPDLPRPAEAKDEGTVSDPAEASSKRPDVQSGTEPQAKKEGVRLQEPPYYDPTPVEKPSGEQVSQVGVEPLTVPEQVVPFAEGVDPFSSIPPLKKPAIGEDDPRGDILRLGPEVPPEPGEVALPFPTIPKDDEVPPRVEPVPLKVLRHSPEGEVENVNAVMVTFNQPMVPLASIETLTRATSPMTIEPAVEGEYLWLGTDTVAFRPKLRMPYATEYQVTVREGVQSALGQSLAEPYQFALTTPRPKLINSIPGDGASSIQPQPDLTLVFNAAVDLNAVFSVLELRDTDNRLYPLVLLGTPPENPMAVTATDKAEDARYRDRALVVRPAQELPLATQFLLMVKEDLRTTEGPLVANWKYFVRFATYAPLSVERISCGWGFGNCYPGAPVRIEFNNALVQQSLDNRVTFSPAVDGLRLRASGNTMTAFGRFLPSQAYSVHVSIGIEDVFGQKNLHGSSAKVQYRTASPLLQLARRGMFVIEARESHDVSLSAMNLDVGLLKLAVVRPEQISTALDRVNGYHKWDDEPTQDFQVNVDRELKLTESPNQIFQTAIDLSSALDSTNSTYGTIFVDLKSRTSRGLLKGWNEYRQTALVQITDLGVTAALSDDAVHVQVTRLSNAKPINRAEVRFVQKDGGKVYATGFSDVNGMVKLPGPMKLGKGPKGPFLIWVKSGTDAAFLPLSGSVQGGSHVSSYSYHGSNDSRIPVITGMVFSERGLYRPAEEVHVTVLARLRSRGPDGDLEPLPPKDRTLTYSITDSRRNVVDHGSVRLSSFGTGSLSYKVPKNAPLGHYTVQMKRGAGQLSGGFSVQEYRTPEFETTVEFQHQDENILVGRELTAVVEGKYLFGAPMAGAEMSWSLRSSESYFHPPGNTEFSFGEITDSWESRSWQEEDSIYEHHGGLYLSGSGKLDAFGRLTLPLKLDPVNQPKVPLNFTLEAQVFDHNRQVVAGRTSILAHRAERYVGIELDRSVVAAGETVEVSSVVTRLDGSRYDNAEVNVKLMRIIRDEEEFVTDSGGVSYRIRTTEEQAGSCSIMTGLKPGKCLLEVEQGGSYLVRAETLDLAERPARSAVRLWAYGKDRNAWTESSDYRVDVVLDKKEYKAGDTASVLIQSPFPRSTGMVTISREGFADVLPVILEGPTHLLKVELKEHWLPGVRLGVSLVRGRLEAPGKTKDDRARPAFAYGEASLIIDRSLRRIDVAIKPSAEAVSPGQTVTIDVSTTGPDGKPLKANVALAVVDEGVLSLISYSTPDPLSVLYVLVGGMTGIIDLRPYVLARKMAEIEFEQEVEEESERKEDPTSLSRSRKSAFRGGLVMSDEDSFASGGEMMPPESPIMEVEVGAGSRGETAPVFALREIFKSTAYFNGDLKTDADGQLSVTVKMPGNLTRFRVMAIAADATNLCGSADAQVRTRRPIVVRPSLPRFLNFGDRFRAAVVINNQTGFKTEVQVRCEAVNAIIHEREKMVRIPHGEAREVYFDAAAGSPGPATFRFAAVALTDARDTDAAVLTIPTLIPATSEAFATYGVVDEATRQPLVPPEDAFPGFGGLDVSLSSTALTGLQDAVRYLYDYPYECTEQLCSRVLPIMALTDLIADFELGETDSPEMAKAMVREGLKKLYTRQRSDGGFGIWPDSEESWLYITAYAVYTMQMAVEKGYSIEDSRLKRAQEFLNRRLDNPYKWEKRSYGAQTMAALVLTRDGQAPRKHLRRLFDRAKAGKDFPFYASGWLMEALHIDHQDEQVETLLAILRNAGVETAGAIHFSEKRTESLQLMMHSEDRTDAILLNSLLVVKPDDSRIEKLVRGLVRARVRGRWSTTQANVYALLALDRYYRVFEKEEPDYVAKLWLGDEALLAHKFKGRSMEIARSRIPMRAVLSQAAQNLVLAKTGPGRLYYRLGLTYAPRNLKLDALDRGFAVERVYLPVKGEQQLSHRPDGTWLVKAGSYLRVKVRVVVPDRRYYVAIIDPLPAGFEVVNEVFTTSSSQGVGESQTELSDPAEVRWWYGGNPWDHEEKRDDRVQLFKDNMYGGVYEYTYLARATTVGTFNVPPARAEEMYEPETFGRSASTVVVVE
jgi:alpha-2-macroglobulin